MLGLQFYFPQTRFKMKSEADKENAPSRIWTYCGDSAIKNYESFWASILVAVVFVGGIFMRKT